MWYYKIWSPKLPTGILYNSKSDILHDRLQSPQRCGEAFLSKHLEDRWKMTAANYRTFLENNLLLSAGGVRLGRSFIIRPANNQKHNISASKNSDSNPEMLAEDFFHPMASGQLNWENMMGREKTHKTIQVAKSFPSENKRGGYWRNRFILVFTPPHSQFQFISLWHKHYLYFYQCEKHLTEPAVNSRLLKNKPAGPAEMRIIYRHRGPINRSITVLYAV